MRYRIVYKVAPEKKVIVVWAIGHRRDIYENFSEQLGAVTK
jgi:mRNA-degrading endonuclease RelE of RelBE toxin-antitoxin system